MKNSILSYFKVGSVLLLFLLFASCSVESPEPDLEPNPEPEIPEEVNGQISLENTALKAYEIVTLKIVNVHLEDAEYEIGFGSQQVKAAKHSANMLVFVVPGDIPSGKYEINAEFAHNSIEVDLTEAENIQDPEKSIAEFIGDIDSDIDLYQNLMGTESIPASMENARGNIQASMDKLNTLSEEEKQQVAQVLKANEDFFIEAKKVFEEYNQFKPGDETSGRRNAITLGGDWGDCEKVYCHVLSSVAKASGVILLAKASTAGAAIVGVVAGLDMALSIILNKKSITISATLAIIDKGLDVVYFPQSFVGELLSDRIDREFTGSFQRVKSNEVYLLKGEEINFQLKVNSRTLNASDANSSNTMVKEAVNALEKAKEFYTVVLDSPAGEFPEYQDKTETKAVSSFDELTIAALGNSNVSVSEPSGTVEDFNLIFNSSSKEKEPFTLSISYDSGIEEIIMEYEAVLFPQRPAHKVEISGGNNQEAAPDTKLSKALQVKVKDGLDNLLENVEVEWVLKSGGGSLSASATKTNSDGIATVEWTLGEDPEEDQIVEAIVRNMQGEIVEGAPVVFNANVTTPSIVGRWRLYQVVEHSTGDQYDPNEIWIFEDSGDLKMFEPDEDKEDEMGYIPYNVVGNILSIGIDSGTSSWTIEELTSTDLIIYFGDGDPVFYLERIE